MSAIARLGDLVVGGVHCHGHPHAPPDSPGRIVQGSSRVFVGGRPVARVGDLGFSVRCCGGQGRILLLLKPGPPRVYVEGRPVASVGSPTLHCEVAPGRIQTGQPRVQVP